LRAPYQFSRGLFYLPQGKKFTKPNKNIRMRAIGKVNLALIAGILLWFTACKKTETKPAPASAAVNYKNMARQVALNIYNSLSGKNAGSKAGNPFKMTAASKGVAANGINMLCGFRSDTSFSSNLAFGDTSRSIYSSISQIYNCNGNTVNGYTMADTTTTHDNAPSYTASSIVNQQYVVTALNSSYTLVSVTGGIQANLGWAVSGGDNSSTYSTYTLSGVEVSTAVNGLPDVITGQATFYSMIVILGPGTGIDGYFGGTTGTIVFLGNFMAKVSLAQGNTYLVNMLTGATSQV
jgi:hypothetical protein